MRKSDSVIWITVKPRDLRYHSGHEVTELTSLLRLRAPLVLVAASLAAAAAAPQPTRKTVPTPEQIIGFQPGTDRKLADFGQVTRYFQALAAASPRVQLFTIGKSTEGRDMILAAISSEENLRRLARFQDIARQLADSRGLTDDQAHRLAREAQPLLSLHFRLPPPDLPPSPSR